jgi:hypothetical protein
MKLFTRKRLFVNLLISLIISMLLVLPMLFEILGFSSFGGPGGNIGNHSVMRPEKIQGLLGISVYLFLLVFSLISVYIVDRPKYSWHKKIVTSVFIAVFFYILLPFAEPRVAPHLPDAMAPFGQGLPGDENLKFQPHTPIDQFVNFRRIFELIFVLITTGLIGKVFELLGQREKITVENEKLRAENLQSQYNLLLNQMNPHFFFNSMNSLSSLVREGRKGQALRYIEELSNTFRYVMQSSDREMVTLEEEISSLSAYCYMLLVRFEGKIFFNIEIDESLMKMKLPVLSLQPLIENVVKHNAITFSDPLTVNIAGRSDGYLVITNRLIPRQDKADPTGIGLKNLANRYKLLSGEQILIEDDGQVFRVTLPLKNDVKNESTDNRR